MLNELRPTTLHVELSSGTGVGDGVRSWGAILLLQSHSLFILKLGIHRRLLTNQMGKYWKQGYSHFSFDNVTRPVHPQLTANVYDSVKVWSKENGRYPLALHSILPQLTVRILECVTNFSMKVLSEDMHTEINQWHSVYQFLCESTQCNRGYRIDNSYLFLHG